MHRRPRPTRSPSPHRDWHDALANCWLVNDRDTLDALLGYSGLTPAIHLSDFPSGHRIFVEGQPAEHIYVVISGTVKLTATLPHGRKTVRSLLGPGDVIDTAAAFDGLPHGYTAMCQTLVRAAWLNTGSLRRLISRRPQLAPRWLRAMAGEIRKREQHVALASSDDVPGRVARELITLADRFGTPAGGTIQVEHTLSRQEFAELVGAAKAPVSKALANFVARGWIVTGPGRFEIIDIEQLRHRALPAGGCGFSSQHLTSHRANAVTNR